MKQRLLDLISIRLTCPTTIQIGDIVEITGDLTCAPVASIGSSNVIGPVVKHRNAPGDPETTCTVETSFIRRWQRIAGSAAPVGSFVFGPGGVVFPYTPGSPTVVTGTTTGVHTVVVSTSDTLKIAYGVGGADQTITLTAGVDVTMAAIAAEINATAVGFVASVDATGPVLVLTGNDIWKPIEVKAVANDAYTLLGLTAGITAATGPSHDPNAIRGLIISAAANPGDVVDTLEM